MNWLRKLLRWPGEKSAAQKPKAPTQPSAAAPPPADLGRLRMALAATTTPEDRASRQAELARALAAAGQVPTAEDPPAVWVEAVCRATDKALALAWAARIEGDSSLAEVATRSRYAEVRLAAAARIVDTAALERVAQGSREKDKRVYRHCTEALRERRGAAERGRRAAALDRALRELLSMRPLPVSRLLELEKELRALTEAGEPLAECSSLAQRARTLVQEDAQALRELQGRLAEAEKLRSELADERHGMHLVDWRARFIAVAQDREPRPEWLTHHAVNRALHEALQEIESRLAALGEELERVRACERFLDALPADEAIDAATIEAWEALPKPAGTSARAALEHRWSVLKAAQVPPPVVEPSPQVELAQEEAQAALPAPVDEEVLRHLLDQLEQHLEEGRLADAETAAARFEQSVAGVALPGPLAQRLRPAQAALARLRGWARWGTDQAREQLVAAAEELVGGAAEELAGGEAEELASGAVDIEERAGAVRALRQDWKRLDSHGPASKAQWERFDAALTQAYQPVAEHRAQEAERHAVARAAKEALCAEWEAWLAGLSWEHADYKAVEAARGQMLTQWRAAPAAGFRDERQLRKRLDAILGPIDAQLQQARNAEVERRERLISAAEALRETPDLGRAMSEAQALQERWRGESGSVRLPRSEEQMLWQRFRAACDAIFARRDAQREQQAQARQALLDGFDATLESGNAGQLGHALSQFRAAWAELGPGARGEGAAEARARELIQRAQQRIQSLRDEKHQTRFALMAQKAALAQRVEAAAAAAEPAQEIAAEAHQLWDSLPRLPGKAERMLAQRLANANAATAQTLAQGTQAREALLLDLEIALGLPSPQAQAQTRRASQIATLQQRFSGGSGQAPEPEELALRWYATAARPDAEQETRMALVVRRLADGAGG